MEQRMEFDPHSVGLAVDNFPGCCATSRIERTRGMHTVRLISMTLRGMPIQKTTVSCARTRGRIQQRKHTHSMSHLVFAVLATTTSFIILQINIAAARRSHTATFSSSCLALWFVHKRHCPARTKRRACALCKALVTHVLQRYHVC